MEFAIERIKPGFIICLEAIEKSAVLDRTVVAHRVHITANGRDMPTISSPSDATI
jgi:hypothetical protein